MATTDESKRKEPEPEAEKPSADAIKEEPDAKKARTEPESTDASKEVSKEVSKEEPDAKKARTGPEAKVVRKQVEYYLSDDNLRHDKFFHEKIAADEGGWLDIALILSCNKMKAMKATKDDVVASLKESKIEMKEGGAAVRRPGNAPLPKLEAKPVHHNKKSSLHAHDGGCIIVFRGVPAEQSWMQIKDALKEKLPGKTSVWHASQISDQAECFLAAAPFEGDQVWFEALELEVGGAKLKCEVCSNEELQKFIKTLPKHVKDKRDNAAKRRQKERQRPILVNNRRFMNVGALRTKIKEIIQSRNDGEELKADSADFNLIRAVLNYHPKGDEKLKGLIGIKVAKSTLGDSRCFFMIKEDKTEEDISMMKCLNELEANPPFVVEEKTEKPEGKDKDKTKAKGKDEKKEAAPAASDASAVEGAKPVTPAAAPAQEEKKAEEEKKPEEEMKAETASK